jgi:hypothetical protein
VGALHAALLGMRADGRFEARYGDGFAVLHDGAVAEVWALHSAPEGSAAAAGAARHQVALARRVRAAGRRGARGCVRSFLRYIVPEIHWPCPSKRPETATDLFERTGCLTRSVNKPHNPVCAL